jgi:multiple sugar transport system substrate-binding protein
MNRPQTEAEYLARIIPPSVAATRVSRRSFLRGVSVAGAGIAAPALLAACGDAGGEAEETGAAGGAAGGGEVSFGLNEAPGAGVPYDRNIAAVEAFQEASGTTVDINATDPNTYQEQINQYLQGNPDDVFQWFAGYRARFFANQGLTGDISDVWDEVGDGFNEGFRNASTGDDGNQIFLPFYYYPWAIFYRPSVFEANGYTVPTTIDEFESLCQDMQSGGMNPVAFGASDGWPQMGTFDYLNMRTNGYQFHIELMANEQRWDSDEVKAVFETWARLLPYHQPDSLGRTWQEAAQSLQNNESGMYLLGLFVNQQFEEGEDRDDLDFFNFPEIDPAIGADAVEAPIDGFMMRADPENEANAKALLRYLGSAEAIDIYLAEDRQIGAHSDTDTGAYDALQTKSAELVNSAANISQFLDRDTRPDFASTVIIPEFQRFIGSPDAIDDVTSSIQAQADAIFATDA